MDRLSAACSGWGPSLWGPQAVPTRSPISGALTAGNQITTVKRWSRGASKKHEASNVYEPGAIMAYSAREKIGKHGVAFFFPDSIIIVSISLSCKYRGDEFWTRARESRSYRWVAGREWGGGRVSSRRNISLIALTLIFSIVREGKKCAQVIRNVCSRTRGNKKIVRYSKRKKKEEKFIAYPFSF